jgi:rubrerythrin
VSTKDNLKEAFAGESQAYMKYMAFAKKAQAEGHSSIARLFTATADAETVHANHHLNALGVINTTAENLITAKAGETHEFESMYPPFIEEAKKDGDQKALRAFQYAVEAEKVHAKLYAQAAEEIDKKVEHTYYLCPVCGNIEIDQIPDKCYICGVPGSKFIKY